MIGLTAKHIRTFGLYIPKTVLPFDEAGKLVLFTYNDENTFRDSFFLGAGAQAAFLSYYCLFYKSVMSLVGFAASGLFSLGVVMNAKNTPAQISLLSDGKTIELDIYTAFRGTAKTPLHVPISELRGTKGRYGLKLLWKDKLYVLNQEGKIHNPELLYAVLRGLNIETRRTNASL